MEDEHPSREGRAAEQGGSAQKASTGNDSLASPKHAHPRELGTDDPGLQHQPRRNKLGPVKMQTGKEETEESLDRSQGRSHSIPTTSVELILSLDFQDFSLVGSFKQLNEDFTLHFRPTCSPAVSVLTCMVCTYTFVYYINQWHYATETTTQKFMLLVEQHYFSSEYWKNTQVMRT